MTVAKKGKLGEMQLQSSHKCAKKLKMKTWKVWEKTSKRCQLLDLEDLRNFIKHILESLIHQKIKN